MDESIQQALERDRTIDITTMGRENRAVSPYRDLVPQCRGALVHYGDSRTSRLVCQPAGTPGFTFHLKQSVRTDLPARATAILDKAQRREIMATIHQKLSGKRDLEAWVEGSPLVAVELLIE